MINKITIREQEVGSIGWDPELKKYIVLKEGLLYLNCPLLNQIYQFQDPKAKTILTILLPKQIIGDIAGNKVFFDLNVPTTKPHIIPTPLNEIFIKNEKGDMIEYVKSKETKDGRRIYIQGTHRRDIPTDEGCVVEPGTRAFFDSSTNIRKKTK